ncbi:hypothetical protein GCM10007036_23830 [Alsobacter metallidurans]|uniref:Transposase n=1 Tax=Alsobacter metallidurans TaxID=340221 RepID=A0A917I7S9_9HYPH|nr:hypothetical protein GCM10007036_23830 [Alsobacter metallidurans]
MSKSDPAAQWTGALKGHAFFAYAANYLIDLKARRHRRCGSQPRDPASRGRRGSHHDRAHPGPLRPLPARLAADSAYGSAEILTWLVHERGIEPHIPVFDKSERQDGTFSRSEFAYDYQQDVYVCLAGNLLRQRQRTYRNPRPLAEGGHDALPRQQARL